MTTLNEIRDELAHDHVINPPEYSGSDPEAAFANGFDAGVAEMKKRVEKTWIEMHREIDNSCDDESVLEMIDWALEEYRKSVE